ncbi:MAG TPA: hypothetical protein VKQ32_25450 [Polyangia bacterium]|nr:hypothetical protein [Polyangia bacterium]
MSKQRSSVLSLLASGALAAGALLIGSPGRAAASEPTTSAEAQQMAQEAQARAEQFKAMGGTGYKTGLVQREEREAARYQALADQLAAQEPNVTGVIVTTPDGETAAVGVVVTPPAAPVTSPEVEQDAARADHYRAMGGTGYKAGFVQSAEAQERRDEAAVQPPAPAPQPNPICLTSKPAAILTCS